MVGKRIRRWWWVAGSSFAVGLALGVGMLIGGAGSSRSELPLFATATDRNDTLSMCTFSLGEGVEGVATLDGLTGELKVFVINPKTAKFNMAGKTNVLTPLKVERGKKVSLLMVSGMARFAGGAGAGINVGDGCLYVMDGNSGKFVCYGLAYAPNALATGVEGEVVINLLDGNTARTVNIKQP
jgi:hypothetical protein